MKKRVFVRDKYFFVLLLFMFIIAGFLFFDFILQKRLYIFFDIGGDTRQSYWPMYKYILDSIRNGTLGSWSFQMGLGTSTFALYAFLFDPFMLILLLFPIKSLAYGILIISLIKIFISGIIFYAYLYLFSIKKFPAVISSLIWAFNGYMMLWGQHYWFATMLVFFTFIIYTLELWIMGKRPYLFSISIAIMAINSPYFLFMVSVFIFFYVLFRLQWIESKINVKKVLGKITRFFVSYFVGLGAGAIVFLPVAYLILSSPRTSGSLFNGHIFYLATYKEYVSIFLRLFSNNSLGVGLQYFGSINYYEGPLLCSSLLWILAFPQLFFMRMSMKNKILLISASILSFIILIFPFFSTFFSAFSSFNYRWNFLIEFLNVLTIASVLHSISQLKKVSYAGLFISFIFVVIGWYYCDKVMILHNMIPAAYVQSHFIKKMALIVGIFLVVYSVTLMFLHKKNYFTWLILLALVSVELITFNYQTVNDRYTVPANVSKIKEGYYDYTNETLDYIKNKDSSLYRLDKNYVSYSFNDSLFQNYNGVKSYNSLNNPNYLTFLKELNTRLNDNNLAGGYDQRPVLRDLTGVKYVLSKDNNVPIDYKKQKNFGDVHLFENPDALPIGFTYNSYVTEKEFNQLMPFEKDGVLLNAAVVKNESPLNKYVIPKSESNLKYNIKTLKVNNGSIRNVKGNNDFEISSEVGDPGIIVPVTKPEKGWKVEFEVQGPNNTSGQIYWKSGSGDYNQTNAYWFNVTGNSEKVAFEIDVKNINQLRFDPGDAPGVYRIRNLRIVPVSNVNDQNSIKKLKMNKLNIVDFKNSYIKGTINVNKKQMLFLSIPYDKGWKLKVDGKEVQTEQINIGFIGALIPKGNHIVELQYKQPLLTIGTAISLIGCVLIILQIIFFKKKNNEIKKLTD
ncbi:YfhO family protein [Neobacillus sp. PS3-12]|uniref:YfhO family protein n=1 Tax=Neobacillus sp. PS3-12 TaxID=3070677 RepID=UPI0027DEB3DC|nr:YfhO family protein [Neobacillus sp. PS3-12]WML54781.1 YfhO family protein [Neobacillus sp. PS3-12]